MAQQYHNMIDVLGTQEQRLRFVADAVSQSLSWGWDWEGLEINSEADGGVGCGKSRLDFRTRNFPKGLANLMATHPEVTLEGDFLDLSAPRQTKMKVRNNRILEKSSAEGEDEIFGEEPEAADGSKVGRIGDGAVTATEHSGEGGVPPAIALPDGPTPDPRLGSPVEGDPDAPHVGPALDGPGLDETFAVLDEDLNLEEEDFYGDPRTIRPVEARKAQVEPAEAPVSASGPTKTYTAMVVRELIARTPYTTHIRGIPARSPEEARARAEEAALRLPEPQSEPEDDAVVGWDRGEDFDPEFAELEVVAIFEEITKPEEETHARGELKEDSK